MFKILTIFAILLCTIICETNHNFISLDNFLPEQLQGLLNGNWKQQLVGKAKTLIGNVSLPFHQTSDDIFRRHFLEFNKGNQHSHKLKN